MELLLRTVGSLALIAVVPIVFQARRVLRQTTLSSAWLWSAILLLTWLAIWTATQWTDAVEAGVGDQLWYGVAVLALCPPVAVLGAKRPGTRVWTWFVLLPLLVVLGWPAWTVWGAGFPLPRLQLATPAVLGYAVVLVMAVGNYLGTRYFLPAACYGAALVLLVGPFSETAADSLPATGTARYWATLLFSAAPVVAMLLGRRPARAAAEPCDQVWTDFRDAFGIVWAKRIQERLNHTAVQEGWPARLEQDGIMWTDPTISPSDRSRTSARVEHTFRWLLRRFVDESWIDERMQEKKSGERRGERGEPEAGAEP